MKRLLTILLPVAILASFSLLSNVDAATVCQIFTGCTGTSTAPAYGQVLIGGKNGEYEYVASSTLGSGGGGGSNWATTSSDYWLSQRSTSNLPEGSNLYYTAARDTANFISNLAGTTSVASIATLANLSLPAAQLTGFGVPFYSFFHATTTDALGEGLSNLYFTTARATSNFISNLAATTSVASITTLSNLSLPISQVTGLSATSPLSYSGGTVSIANAAADGSTKGAASFAASDFDAASGIVSLDYANGQKASGSQPGFLSSADWTTFNGKQAALSASFPLQLSGASLSWIGLATSSNVASSQVLYATGANTFQGIATSAPTFSAPLTTSGTPGYLVGGSGLTIGLDTTGAWSGNAGSATKLANARTINGVSFDGTANIIVASTTLLGDKNTWSSLQAFSYASSTGFSTSYASSTQYQGAGLASCTGSTNFLQWTGGFFSCGAISSSGITALGSGYASTTLTAITFSTTTATVNGLTYGMTIVTTNGALTFTPTVTGTYTGPAGSVANALTINNGGSGAASGSTFDGSSAVTLSYNSIGAVPTGRNVNTTFPLQGGGALSGDLTLSTAFGTTSNTGLTADRFIYTSHSGVFVTAASSSLNLPNAALANSTISGVALGGTLSSHTHDSTLSGTSYNGSAAVSDWGINLSNPNTWTGKQTINNASSTAFSTSYASSTIASFGNASSTLFSSFYASSTNLQAGTATTSVLVDTGVTSALHLADSIGRVTAYSGTSCTNQFVRSLNGAGVATCASVNLASDVTGTLAYGNGGTGTTTAPVGQLLYGGSTAYQSVATTSATIGSSLSYSGTFGALVGGAAGTLSLNLGNANSWTALQTFANATTTLLSATYASSTNAFFGVLNIPSITSSLLKTDSAGKVVAAVAGTDYANFSYPFPSAATTTGLGLYASTTIGAGGQTTGLTVSGGATTTGNAYIAGTLGIGTTTPWAAFAFNPTAGQASNQFAIGSSTATNFLITNSGYLGIGTSSPFSRLTLDRYLGIATSSILVAEYSPATSTSMTVDCRDSNTIHVSLGTSATTLTLAPMLGGQNCTVIVSNPNASAGAITWAANNQKLYWAGGTAPTQTTTANKRDVWSFKADQLGSLATSTPGTSILGAMTANF